MSSKAEQRAARQRAKEEQFERAKARMLASVESADGPRLAQLPHSERMRLHIGVDPRRLDIPQVPKTKVSGSVFDRRVTWCVRKGDVEGEWSWGDVRAWTQEEWAEVIGPKFDQFETLTWGEVQRLTSGEQHLMHHEQELHTICEEAQRRWVALGLEQFDTLFRFRLSNVRRFWGFRLQGHFFGVWWDRTHRIYPT